ncbi:MAG TPA: hypothetical protein VLS51_00120 [Propionibacteriaceae bacterium]|nr:hypothetical protein [Propionibacteriaceae bacterium]
MTSLPLHPLVVHAAVMLLVLVPLGVLVSLVWPGLRNRLDWLLPVGALGGFVAAIAAERTGQDLVAQLKQGSELVAKHADLGEKGPWVAGVFALATIGWWLTSSQVAATWVDARLPWIRRGRLPLIASVLMAIACAVTLVVIFLLGDSGATAVWTSR